MSVDGGGEEKVVKRLLAWWRGQTYSGTPAWCLRKIEEISTLSVQVGSTVR